MRMRYFNYTMLILAMIWQPSRSFFNQFGQQHTNQFNVFQSTSAGSNHFVSLAEIGSNSSQALVFCSFYNTTTYDWDPSNYTANMPANGTQIRTASFNQNMSNSIFILFNTSTVMFSSMWQPQGSVIFQASTYNCFKIFDVVFGNSIDQIFILASKNNTGLGFYITYYFNSTSYLDYYQTLAQVVLQNGQIAFCNNQIFTVMESLIYRYQYSPIYIWYSFSWTSATNSPRFNADINTNMSLAFDQTNLIIYDISGYPAANFSTTAFGISANFSDVKFVKYPYIVILTSDNILREFDYFQIQKIVTHQPIQGGVYRKFHYMRDVDLIVLYQPSGSTYVQRYYNNGSYLCDALFQPDGLLTCVNCSTNYTVNLQGQCEKNGFFIPKPVPATQITTNYTSTGIEYPSAYPYPSQLSKEIHQSLNTSVFNKSIETSAKILSFSPIRILPNSFIAFTYFFSDLNDYRHHRTVYPEVMQAFMAGANLFNAIKVTPWFLDEVDNITGKIKNKTGLFESENSLFLQYMQLNAQTDPDKAYFLSFSMNFYTLGLLQCVCYFTVLKLLHLLFYLLKLECNIFTFIYEKIRRETMWWVLIVAFYESNIDDMTFDCALQLRMPSYFSFENKNNLMLDLLVLFTAFAYSLTFYLFVYRLFKNNSSKILLQRCQQFQSYSFLAQPLILIFRQVLRSFTNGIFIDIYKFQITFLFFTDILIIIIIIKIYRHFKSRLVFSFSFGYFLSVTVIDIYFVIEALQQNYLPSRELFSLILVLSMTAFTFLIFLTNFGHEVYLMIMFIRARVKKHDITPKIIDDQHRSIIRKKIGPIVNMTKDQQYTKTQRNIKRIQKIEQADPKNSHSNNSIYNRTQNIFNYRDNVKKDQGIKKQHNCFMVIQNQQRKFKEAQLNVY